MSCKDKRKITNLLELEKELVWHPCSQMRDYEDYPAILITHARGCWLYKTDNTKILDAISSWWTNSFGHCNKFIANSIKKQLNILEHIIFANYTHPQAIILADNLTKLFNCKLSKVFFVDNGSAAVEASLKMSFQYWQQTGNPQKNKFAYLTGAYHGETLGALAVGALGIYKNVYQKLLFQAIEIQGPDCFRCPFQKTRNNCNIECFKFAVEKLTNHQLEIAAIIVEPLTQCANGMTMYPAEYLIKLRELCNNLNIHLICDEIAVGFGRLATIAVSETIGVTPDFCLFSKALTGGFLPLAAIVTSEKIYSAFYADYIEFKAFMHSHSYTANPLACAAANAVFELFNTTDILQKIKKKGAYIFEKINKISEHKNIGEIRANGMICAIELVADKTTKKRFDWRKRIGYQIYRNAEKKGVLLRNLGDIIYFMPPFVITKKEIDFMIDTAICAINEILD